jgi:hypothetical protein
MIKPGSLKLIYCLFSTILIPFHSGSTSPEQSSEGKNAPDRSNLSEGVYSGSSGNSLLISGGYQNPLYDGFAASSSILGQHLPVRRQLLLAAAGLHGGDAIPGGQSISTLLSASGMSGGGPQAQELQRLRTLQSAAADPWRPTSNFSLPDLLQNPDTQLGPSNALEQLLRGGIGSQLSSLFPSVLALAASESPIAGLSSYPILASLAQKQQESQIRSLLEFTTSPMSLGNLSHDLYVSDLVSSMRPISRVIPRSQGGSGAPAALLREQGLSGPEDVTSLSESFPVKLHRLLLDLELQEGGTDIASFVPNGIAFAVHNTSRFEGEVMRKYFPRMNRFASFQRQLNLYDFRRVNDGPARGAYYHPSFNRDFPVLCRAMKRTKIKGQPKNEDD